MSSFRDWARAKIYEPASSLPPSSLAQVLTVGVWGGLFPVPGVTTGVVLLASKVLSFKMVMTSLAVSLNLLMTPVQIPGVVFFASSSRHLPLPNAGNCTSDFLCAELSKKNFVGLLKKGGWCLGYGVLLWGLLIPAVHLVSVGVVKGGERWRKEKEE